MNDDTRTVTIALRVWQQASWSSYSGGGPHGSSYLGATPLLRERLQAGIDAYIHTAMQRYILALLETLAGLVSLALFLFRRREREYLWFGCMMLVGAAVGAYDIHRTLYGAEIRAFYRYTEGLSCLARLPQWPSIFARRADAARGFCMRRSPAWRWRQQPICSFRFRTRAIMCASRSSPPPQPWLDYHLSPGFWPSRCGALRNDWRMRGCLAPALCYTSTRSRAPSSS